MHTPFLTIFRRTALGDGGRWGWVSGWVVSCRGEGVQNLMGLEGDSDQKIKLKHLYHNEYQQLSLSVLLFSLPLLKQFVTISCFIKNARTYCQYCIFWGGSRWVQGCHGGLIDPPKLKESLLKHLASKAGLGLEVFPPASMTGLAIACYGAVGPVLTFGKRF